MKKQNKEKTGLWLIGARGGVASTAILGLSALQAGKTDGTGLVTENYDFKDVSSVFPAWSEFFVGGCEIRTGSIYDTVATLGGIHPAIRSDLIQACKRDLAAIDSRLVPGTIRGSGKCIASLADMDLPTEDAPAETVARLESQMKAFVEQNGLSSLIVVNVSSTEPVNAAVQSILEKGGDDSKKLNSLWDKALNKKCSQSSESSLPASSLYGYAAMKNGWTFINFTPSTGVPVPLGDLWSEQYGSAYMGFDGKTGETLMKSVLAPMFRNRNFNVMSWVGHNIFGNLDAVVLDDPANKTAKVASKDRLLGEILGYRPQTLVTIERINSLGDWKTAWDHIHFQGFLGTPMALQFTWEGCDSILAAPLVLDLSRLALTARRRGQTGRLDFLSSFFKSPQGASTHDFARQYLALYDWVMGAQNGN